MVLVEILRDVLLKHSQALDCAEQMLMYPQLEFEFKKKQNIAIQNAYKDLVFEINKAMGEFNKQQEKTND